MEKYSENIVIGNGIMAKQLMFVLKEKLDDITCIHSDSFAPPCSYSSTAVNCTRGAKRGISPLGDLILDSHQVFEDFYNKHQPDGISKSYEIQTWELDSPNHEKWLRRYGSFDLTDNLRFSKSKISKKLCFVAVPAYIISTDILFKWYDGKLNRVNFVDGFVIDILKTSSGYKVQLKNGEVYSCKRLYVCAGYMGSEFKALTNNLKYYESLKKQKKVYGVYLYCKLSGDDYGLDLEKSFSLSYEFIRLIYRKESHDIVISFPDVNKDAFLLNSYKLKTNYEKLRDKLNLQKLPEFNSYELKQGIRSKGHKRMPFYEELDSDLFLFSGLYKNAFVFSYYFSEKYLHDLNN